MGTILTIQFPENFEQRYNKYRIGILGSKKIVNVQDIEDDAKQEETTYDKLQKKLNALKLYDDMSENSGRQKELTLLERINKNTEAKRQRIKLPRQDNLLLTKELKPQITVGKLASYSDGTIRYGDKILDLRNQLKDLCRFFMRNPKRLLTIDDIREEIVGADKRKTIPNSTISKYVSELRNSLKIHFQKEVIFNQKEEGWYFKTKE